MPRRLLILIAAALLAASCSSSDTLATVNGVAITKDDVVAIDPVYEDPLGVVTGDNLRQDVTSLIAIEAAAQSAQDDYGVVLDEATIADRIANPPERWSGLIGSAEGNAEAAKRYATITLVADGVVPQLLVEDYGGWAAVLESYPDIVSKVCVRHISLTTEEEADAVLVRLLAGEEFSDLVAELSLDQTSADGQLIGPDGVCLSSYASVAPELAVAAASAELDTPSGPVPLGGAYSVFVVDERYMPGSAEELAAAPMDYLDLSVAANRYGIWVSERLRDADVEVSSALGTWSGAGLAIEPPSE